MEALSEETSFAELEMAYLAFSRCEKRSWRRDVVSLGHLRLWFGGKLLSSITPREVDTYKAQRRAEITARRGEDGSMASVNREIALLRHMFTMGARWGMAKDNPVKGTRMFRETPRERVLSYQEEERLLNELKGVARSAAIVLLNTGLRAGELSLLRWTDLDRLKGTLRIVHTKSCRPRTVPLNATAAGELLKLDQLQEYIFAYRGKRMKRMNKGFNSACRRAGIRDLRIHDLRHTFATRLAERGANLVSIQKLLGHTTLAMTQRYVNPAESDLRSAVEMLA